MDRRRFLAAAAAVGAAGCAGRPGRSGTPGADQSTASATPADTATAAGGLGHHGFPSTICEEPILEDFGIRAVVEPAFAGDWSGRAIPDRYTRGEASGLVDEAVVIGLTAGSTSRAYPLSVVWWHEVVNDVLGDPVIVTYCPLCASGLVAERRVRGEPTRFGVSGQLWDPPRMAMERSVRRGRTFAATRWNASADVAVRAAGNLVMYDVATRSFWSQLLGEAICGPAAGDRLSIVPSALTSWADWRRRHPDTDVLLPPPHSGLME